MDESGATPAGLEFVVGGMTCAGCAAAVVKAARGVSGVSRVKLDFDEGTLRVIGSTDEAAVTEAVRAAGFALTRA